MMNEIFHIVQLREEQPAQSVRYLLNLGENEEKRR